jgi:hypothetical protein
MNCHEHMRRMHTHAWNLKFIFFIFHAYIYIILILLMVSNIILLNQYVITMIKKSAVSLSAFCHEEDSL